MRKLSAIRDFLHLLVDGWGKPRICDEDGIRSLHFGGGAVQSAMQVSEPNALNLSYTRTMMGFLLFNTEPRHILLVGLGGGSLSKYCYQELPQARITTLEINPDVIALRDEFRIPPNNERFQVVHADACTYLSRNDLQADVILLDGYDASGLPECLCTEAFYSNCSQVLGAQGVLVLNLWGGESQRQPHLERLRVVFNGRVWWSKPPESSSLIVFAVKDEHFYPQWSCMLSKAQSLDQRYRLDLPRLVTSLRLREDPDSDNP